MNNLPNRHSIRLDNYDYSQMGFYFVTICTQNMDCLFGEIKNGKMINNNIGNIVDEWLLKIPNAFENAEIDMHQLMPNHLHVIIIIRNQSCRGGVIPAPTKKYSLGQIIGYFKYQSTKYINTMMYGRGYSRPSFKYSGAKTRLAEALAKRARLDSTIESKRAAPLHKFPFNKIWQRNYYERIIRNEREYWVIKKYVRDNPGNWENDENNTRP